MKSKQLACLFMVMGIGLSTSWLESPVTQMAVDEQGPVVNPGMQMVGQQARRAGARLSVREACRKPAPWQAQWIWVDGECAGTAWFRKEITLTDPPRPSRGVDDCRREDIGCGSTAIWCRAVRPIWAGTMPAATRTDGSTIPASTHALFPPGQECHRRRSVRSWPAAAVSRGQPGFLFEAELHQPVVRS